MTTHKRRTLIILTAAVMVVGSVGTTRASDLQGHVAGQNEIQARIEKQVDAAAADRQAIRTMLQQEDVRRIAASAGLDVERAKAAADVLSGSSLASLAERARAVNADLVGGSDTIVISATTLLIILLIVIILAN